MPRKEQRDNFRVEITPNVYRCYGLVVADAKEVCEKIAEQIRRHVDDVASVQIISDDASVCEFCGNRWTEDDTLYNGGCCDEDQKREALRLIRLEDELQAKEIADEKDRQTRDSS